MTSRATRVHDYISPGDVTAVALTYLNRFIQAVNHQITGNISSLASLVQREQLSVSVSFITG